MTLECITVSNAATMLVTPVSLLPSSYRLRLKQHARRGISLSQVTNSKHQHHADQARVAPSSPSTNGGIADVTEWLSPGVQRFSSHDGKNYTVCRDSPVGCGVQEWAVELVGNVTGEKESQPEYHTMVDV